MAYPTLMAWVADVSGVRWRATALGVYRFWRDAGYAVGALGAGALASHLGASIALSWAAGGVGVFALAAWLRSDSQVMLSAELGLDEMDAGSAGTTPARGAGKD